LKQRRLAGSGSDVFDTQWDWEIKVPELENIAFIIGH
jgi:hypothetical protein